MESNFRIVQLIDSLDAGGAERMAVNYANALAAYIPFSALVSTRKEGPLLQQLSNKVPYLFLNKKGKIGWSAVFKLRSFVKKNKIDIIHAHSTSFLTALLVKLTYSNVKVIWHDHHGNRVHKKGNTNLFLKKVSFLFEGVLVVNQELAVWAKNNLSTKKVLYFPNFISTVSNSGTQDTFLKGLEGKRIVFLANLKNPKNHMQILQAFVKSEALAMGWSLHLIGKDYSDSYSDELKQFISKNGLQNSIFIYDSCNDIEAILGQCSIGILGSTYEGFPVTLLEYGKASLCVLSTKVGYCSTIIKHLENGLVFNPNHIEEIVEHLNLLLSNDKIRIQYAAALHQKVMNHYSDKAIINSYLEWLK